MKKVFLISCIIIGFAACAAAVPLGRQAQAAVANQGDVIINEIAWMGSTNSANDEWMELKNTTNKNIDLSGWTLTSADGKLHIQLKGQILAHGFYLMERTNDDSVPTVSADLIYTGALNNKGEDLTLYDSSNDIVDQANFSSGWPAGDNTTKQTMERIPSATSGQATADWQTSENPDGTPRTENSTGAVTETTDTSEPVATTVTTDTPTPDTQTPPPAITYPSGVIINEILPNPEGADATDEWIELYNSNGTDVDVSGWKLQDTQGITTTYIFPDNTHITGNGYLVLKRPDTKIILDNDQDGLNFSTPDGNIIDTMSYANAPLNQSYSKSNGSWQWSTTLTPGSANIITALANITTPNVKPLSKTQKTDTTITVASAALSQSTNAFSKNTTSPTTLNPWLLFFGALSITLISGIIILIIKFKVYKKHERT